MATSAQAHLQWGAEALWQQLEPLLPGLSVEVLARADSTNTRLLERARGAAGRRSGDALPCLMVAEQQTQGRGRMGRDWQSSVGHSLTFSLSLPLTVADWSGLSLAVGVALAEAFDPAGSRLGVKWPNDLWLRDAAGGGRKLAGVLIETTAVGQRRLAVVGVGVNVLPQALEGLSSGYACLQEIDPAATAPAALAQAALPLVQALLQFEAAGFAAFAARFAARDLLHGQPVTTTGAAPLEGIAEGVDAQGALQLRTASGLQRVLSGEVGVRLRGPEC